MRRKPFFRLVPTLGTFWEQHCGHVADASLVPPFTILQVDTMAFLERRGRRFRIIFRHGGRRYSHTLKNTSESIAQGLKGGIEKTLMLLDQKVLKLPEGVDLLTFIESNGQVEPSAAAAKPPDTVPHVT
jgi:hypothetical protein